jgi:hypothetical protein
MTLLVDTFWDEFTRVAVPLGWVLVEGSRYDPTHITLVTPTGKSASIDMVENAVTITVAGRSRTLNRNRSQWEDGALSVQALLDAYANLPPSWR